MKGKYEKGLKKGSKGSKTEEKQNFPKGNKISTPYGHGNENKNNCEKKNSHITKSGSSGEPVFNSQSNKITEINKEGIKKEKECINQSNEIRIELKIIDQNDINNDVYFLDNSGYKDDKGIKHYHENLKELNESNTELYINNKKVEYKKYFKPENKGIYEIILKFDISIKDCSYMFFNCSGIENINFISFNTTNINNMSNMFCGCSTLKSLPDISNWNMTNVKDMNCMFASCWSLKSLPDISNWNTINVNDMSDMFRGCSSLQSLIDISNWNTINVNNMSNMFRGCSSLQSLTDISNWNTINVNNMSEMFRGC